MPRSLPRRLQSRRDQVGRSGRVPPGGRARIDVCTAAPVDPGRTDPGRTDPAAQRRSRQKGSRRVPGNNLSRDEATARARLIGPTGVTADALPALQTKVHLDLTPGATKPDFFLSTTAVRFSCAEPGAQTFIDLVADEIRSIVLNGVSIEPATNREADRIKLTDLQAENELEIVAEC